MNPTKQKDRVILPAVGGSSLLVIFAVLCLTVFALLGLSTAQANTRLSDASTQAIAEYYAADCEAEAILAQLRAGEMADGVTVENGVYTYRCAVSETQALDVAVTLQDNTYTILHWNLIPTQQWEADDSLTVWDGKTS